MLILTFRHKFEQCLNHIKALIFIEGVASTVINYKSISFYQKLYKKRILCSNYAEFLTNVPKISETARAAMEADLTLEEPTLYS